MRLAESMKASRLRSRDKEVVKARNIIRKSMLKRSRKPKAAPAEVSATSREAVPALPPANVLAVVGEASFVRREI